MNFVELQLVHANIRVKYVFCQIIHALLCTA